MYPINSHVGISNSNNLLYNNIGTIQRHRDQYWKNAVWLDVAEKRTIGHKEFTPKSSIQSLRKKSHIMHKEGV